MNPLPLSFYHSTDVVQIAKNLIGKGLFTQFGPLTGGIIIETEAYAGISDKASHAYNGRRTRRTETMYALGGCAYVYVCYGMHYLLNAVTATQEIPHAVLIRAILPTHGIDTMLQRRKKEDLDRTLCGGPGALCQALGITKECNGWPLDKPPLVISDLGYEIPSSLIQASKRIGVDYAGADALLPYRLELIDFLP
ncbi:MAG: putative 3-methyladenine glycosylase [Parachlamydiales bacterium]|nr:putative 3-methyladenine glycosylase [Parachlamydiales bacterium]